MILEIIKKAIKKIVRAIIHIPKAIFVGIKNKIVYISKSIKFKYNIYFKRDERINEIKEKLSKQNETFLGICHPEWIEVRNSTIDTSGENVLELKEQYNDVEAKMIAQEIINAGKRMVFFSAFAYGWEKIIKALKEIDDSVEIRIVIHGSNSLLSEPYDWDVYKIMLDLYNEKKVDKLCFVKKSLYEFYKEKGYNCLFLMNDVVVEDKEIYINKKKRSKDKLKIGLYSSGDRWVKNTYNQLSAISLFDNAELDCVPKNDKIETMANYYNIELNGNNQNIPREEMYKKLANNDINLYVTFTECAPLIPLESMELGTLCITGNNHHYFQGTELEKYLVVNRVDDIMEIYSKINYALENKEKIFKLYKEWKKSYSKEVKENRKKFFEY